MEGEARIFAYVPLERYSGILHSSERHMVKRRSSRGNWEGGAGASITEVVSVEGPVCLGFVKILAVDQGRIWSVRCPFVAQFFVLAS
jgi:hypothetical protein